MATYLEGLTKQIREILSKANPSVDISRNYTLTGGLVALNTETCKEITIMNTTGADVSLKVNDGATITLPDSAGCSFSVSNANQIKASGSGTLEYLISN